MVAVLDVKAALGQRDTLALAIDNLHAIEHGDCLVVLVLLNVQPVKHFKEVLPTLVVLVEAFYHFGSLGKESSFYIGLSQGLQVSGIVRTQLKSTLETCECMLLVVVA